MTTRNLYEGHIAEWTVVEHHPWGVTVMLVEDPGVKASIDVPYLRDLEPRERIEGPDDFPPLGHKLRAMVRVRHPDGALHLTARKTDISATQ